MLNFEDETVLCLPRKVLPENWITKSTCKALSWDGFRNFLEDVPVVWMPRSAAECDASFKQLIPYVVVKRSGTGSVACYKRSGSENRLHGFWSVGIGGHINERDCRSTGCEAILNCLNREISEELGIGVGDVLCRFLGVINEEITEVGIVHLGLVFKVVVDEDQKMLPGDELVCLHWVEAEKVQSLELELWSRLAMQLVTGR